jgi:3-methyl-2-oxobutanoate hydroxymethyltransferase
VPSVVGTRITEALEIPTIGIGAGPDTDGQVLVFHDLLGLSKGTPPKFVRQYANLAPVITDALRAFASDVRRGDFPGPDEVYANPTDLTS